MKLLTAILSLLLIGSVPSYAADYSDLALAGSIAQGGLVHGTVEPGTKVLLDGKVVKVGHKGEFVFGFGRDAAPTASLVVIKRDGTRKEQLLKVEKRVFAIERVEGLPPKTVTPPPEWKERRRTETGRVRKARSFTTDDTYWLQGFDKPAEGRFSGFYGSQRILNGKPRSPHYGLDIAGPVGRPITAPAGGTVRLAAGDFLLEGGIVIIDHGHGVTSTLFHMNSVDVSEGQVIEQGTRIGTIGAKGRASGPHVDWRVNWGKVRLDPLLLIEN
ncbi:MAG: M23 family metallopeptidase [Kordiimonas sp.]